MGVLRRLISFLGCHCSVLVNASLADDAHELFDDAFPEREHRVFRNSFVFVPGRRNVSIRLVRRGSRVVLFFGRNQEDDDMVDLGVGCMVCRTLLTDKNHPEAVCVKPTELADGIRRLMGQHPHFCDG